MNATGAGSLGGAASLAARLRSAPVLADPDGARARVADWRSGLDAERAEVRGLDGPWAANLLAALADHSPYLWRLVVADPARVARLLGEAPEASLSRALEAVAAGCRAGAGVADAMAVLRRGKAEIALLVALADLGGVWDLGAVVDALTRFADAAVAAAVEVLLRDAARAGKLHLGPGDLAAGCGLAVLALGKGGGRELNYSSDIDLVVLYDPAARAVPPGAAPAPIFVKLTQGLVRMLGERTADGFVLRVDLRLRPDPGSTAVAVSIPAAMTYYETLGQNWERAAFIKARPMGGDTALGARFLEHIAPFIWRKYFDYAAIADIHAMKRQIHAVRGHASVAVAGHDVKLGRGGIREIEFFVQTQQLIFGGRRPALRGARTLDMLAALCADGWITAGADADLAAAYAFLRRIEHRLQMIADEQTQRLPTDPNALARFARFAGFADTQAFSDALLGHLRAVETHYARLFEHAPGLDVQAGSLVFAGDTIDPDTVETLARLGFLRPAAAVETVRGWHFGRRAAVQSARAREVLTDLVPALLLAFAGSGDPDAAVANLDAALGRMPAAVELFAILKSNAAVRELFADILGLAPRLAAAVASRPHLLDAAIDPGHRLATPDERAARVAALLPADLGAEDFLDRARDVAREESFLIGVGLLSGADAPADAGRRYADLADAIVAATLAHVAARFALEHGVIPGARCVVVAMGRLGSREMTATSDLDLLLIYDADPAAPDSDGPRPLDAPRYFARLTQRLIAALTVTTRRGRLYDVDMRLRPSGNQGPLAARLSSFTRYQAEDADLWEHMALTRARVVAGAKDLAARVDVAVRTCLTAPRTDAIRVPIAAMRALVAREKGENDGWDLKLASGGMLDIEFVAQYLLLRHAAVHPGLLCRSPAAIIAEAERLALLPAAEGAVLIAAHHLYTAVMQMIRLTTEGRFDPAVAGAGLRRRLVASAELPDFATLEREIAGTRVAVRAIFRTILGEG